MRHIHTIFIAIAALVCTATISAQTRVEYEIPSYPADSLSLIIRHTGYTLSYNKQHDNPNWVAWMLTGTRTKGPITRSNKFLADPSLPVRYRVQPSDYTGSGYDRGHMCPAADNQWSKSAMRECFYMSNMCPQAPTLNRDSWRRLETACRNWAVNEDTIYIVCGPIYSVSAPEKIVKAHAIDIPTGFFKVILSLRKGNQKAIGFIYTNDKTKQPLSQTATSVDDIETLTGIDFFPHVPDSIESKVESRYSLSDWEP